MRNKQTQLLSLIRELDSLESEFVESSKKILEAADSNMYSLDLLSGAVSNRAISLLKGFITLAEKNNYLSAIPLIRIQLDNALRFFASTLVENSDDFFNHYLSGKAIKDYKDIKGKNLSDNYLAKQLEKYFSGIKKLYNDTSGYIHLSDKHLFAIANVKGEDSRTIQVSIGNYDVFSIDSKINFVFTMIEVSKIVIIVLEQWKFEKERLYLINKK